MAQEHFSRMAEYHAAAAYARAEALTPEQRSAIARKGGIARAIALSARKRLAIATKASHVFVANAAKRRAAKV
jgi:hypothetical protein